MDCSNPDVDPELQDPFLDTYHCGGASSVRLLYEAQDYRNRKQPKHLDFVK